MISPSSICRQYSKLAATLRATLVCDRWLGPTEGERLCPSRLRRIVRARFAHVSRRTARGQFPRVIEVEIDGRRRYLRLYRMRYLHLAMCGMWTAHTLRELGLIVPATVQRCLAVVGGRACMAVVQEGLPGRRIDEWTAVLGADLGRGLAAWDSIGPARYGRIAPLCKGYPPGCMADRAAIARLDLSDKQRPLVQAALDGLADAEFLGPVALSHGDLHGGNFLDVGGGRVAWIDLDAIRFRPRRHDLAVAELQLLGRQPDAVAAFEAAYFERWPQQRAGWVRHRRRWFAFVSIVQALNLRIDRVLLPGHVRKPEAERRRVARIHFARAAEAMAAADGTQPSGELVSAIVQRAAVIIRGHR